MRVSINGNYGQEYSMLYDIVSTTVSWRIEFIKLLVNAQYTSVEISRNDVVYIKREIAS